MPTRIRQRRSTENGSPHGIHSNNRGGQLEVVEEEEQDQCTTTSQSQSSTLRSSLPLSLVLPPYRNKTQQPKEKRKKPSLLSFHLYATAMLLFMAFTTTRLARSPFHRPYNRRGDDEYPSLEHSWSQDLNSARSVNGNGILCKAHPLEVAWPATHRPPRTSQEEPDYGGLLLRIHPKHRPHGDTKLAPRRVIPRDDALRYHKERKQFLHEMDQEKGWANGNDDDDDDAIEKSDNCVTPTWTSNYFPNCNPFHEIDIPQSIISQQQPQPHHKRHHHDNNIVPSSSTDGLRYLGEGASRQAWLVQPHILQSHHHHHGNHDSGDFIPFVLKTLRLKRYKDAKVRWKYTGKVHTEALIMERLTKSDRIMNIYGHCASSTMVEEGVEIAEAIVPRQDRPQFASQQELRQLQREQHKVGRVLSFNNYTAVEKLDMALAMAEGIAEMSGFEGGVMINSDVHIEQWVQTKDSTTINNKIKLNDMNNADFLRYDYTRQQYCPVYTSIGGDFHSPEEFQGSFVTEQIDVYSMGNNIHCLLTGTWQFPWLEDSSDVQELVMANQRDHVDPGFAKRSYIERRLVEIMERAWIHDPNERATIFEVVEHLRETKQQYHKQEKQRQRQ